MKVKNSGFTLVEVILVLALLGVVGTATGTYISDSFKDSNKLEDKVEIQNSVTALMNKIETTIKEAELPVLIGNKSVYENEFTINGLYEDKKFELIDNQVKVSDGNVYDKIQSVTLTKKGSTGAEIEIVGLGNKYSLTGVYYSQSLNVNKISYTITRVFNNGTTNEELKSGMIGEEVNLNVDGNSIAEDGKITFLGGRYTEDGENWYDFESDTNKTITLHEGIELKIEYEYNRTKKVIKLDEDGDGDIDREIELEYGKEYSLPTPTRTCYIFNGWFVKDTNKQITSNMLVTSIEPITLVAKWTVSHEGTPYYQKTSTQHIKTCPSCNYEFSRENHSWNTVSATCTADGSKTCTVSGCGYKVILEKIGHSYIEKVASEYLKSPATCTSAAVYYKSCVNCGTTSGTFQYGGKAAHKYSNTNGKCTGCGAQQFIECNCCGGNSWTCSCSGNWCSCGKCSSCDGWCYTCGTCKSCCRCSNVTVTPSENTGTTSKPHIHNFVSGVCTGCGMTYIVDDEEKTTTPSENAGTTSKPHIHNFVGGVCSCGMAYVVDDEGTTTTTTTTTGGNGENPGNGSPNDSEIKQNIYTGEGTGTTKTETTTTTTGGGGSDLPREVFNSNFAADIL